MEVWNNLHFYKKLVRSVWNRIPIFFMCSKLLITLSQLYRAFGLPFLCKFRRWPQTLGDGSVLCISPFLSEAIPVSVSI